jgi:hypothetical protein
MKLQVSRPISPKNLQSQTSSQTKNRLALSRLGILHGRLVRQRLNASSGRAAAVVREALKSGELRIIRDDHIDPISGSLFAIVEEDFLDWLNRHASAAATPLAARKQPDRERARQAAIELWGTAGPPEHLSNSLICRELAEWLKKNGQAADISDATILRAVGRR